MRQQIAIVLSGALVAAAFTSCRITNTSEDRSLVHAFHHPSHAGYRPRRLVVMPFAALPGVTDGPSLVRQAFLNEFQKQAGIEVVEAQPDILKEMGFHDPMERGRHSLEFLIQVGDYYGADAVLFGSLSSYRPYEPVIIGAAVEIVSLENGLVVWSSRGVLDASEAQVVRLIRDDIDRRGAGSDADWGIHLRSPRSLARALAHLCVSTLTS